MTKPRGAACVVADVRQYHYLPPLNCRIHHSGACLNKQALLPEKCKPARASNMAKYQGREQRAVLSMYLS